jgi:oligopeptide/dipeptide ABC transporter ATP-binding protein
MTSGTITFDGQSLTDLAEREYCRLRGADLAMVFQDPFASLNPVLWIGDQIAEALLVHGTVSSRKAANGRAVELLEGVGIPAAASRVEDYPHQLAGGMRQRTMIAMAIANGPKLLIADEPTTALDVTVQAEILDLLRSVRDASGMAMVLVTHDLGVVAGIADRVVVMYAGRVVESGTVDEVFYRPSHPYTRGLLGSVPRRGAAYRERLPMIPGSPPAGAVSTRCAFAPRCGFVVERCWTDRPELEAVGPRGTGSAHQGACWRMADLADVERGGRVTS